MLSLSLAHRGGELDVRKLTKALRGRTTRMTAQKESKLRTMLTANVAPNAAEAAARAAPSRDPRRGDWLGEDHVIHTRPRTAAKVARRPRARAGVHVG